MRPSRSAMPEQSTKCLTSSRTDVLDRGDSTDGRSGPTMRTRRSGKELYGPRSSAAAADHPRGEAVLGRVEGRQADAASLRRVPSGVLLSADPLPALSIATDRMVS